MPATETTYTFGLEFCSVCMKLCKCILRRGSRKEVTLLLVTLILLSAANLVIAYFIGLIPSRFYLVLGSAVVSDEVTTTRALPFTYSSTVVPRLPDTKPFYELVAYSLGAVFVVALVSATKNYVTCVFAAVSRRVLTGRLHELLHSGHNLYWLTATQRNKPTSSTAPSLTSVMAPVTIDIGHRNELSPPASCDVTHHVEELSPLVDCGSHSPNHVSFMPASGSFGGGTAAMLDERNTLGQASSRQADTDSQERCHSGDTCSQGCYCSRTNTYGRQTDAILEDTANGSLSERELPDLPSHTNSKSKPFIDNPDQRIVVDVKSFCENLSTLTPLLSLTPFSIGYYTYSSWTGAGYLGPVSVYAFFAVAYCVLRVGVSKVANWIYKQDVAEGDFRFFHTTLLSHSEPAALLGAKALSVFHRESSRRLSALIRAQLSLAARQYALQFSLGLTDYLSGILSYIVLAFPIFYGLGSDDVRNLSPAEMSSWISRFSFVNIYLIQCFSGVANASLQFSAVAGAAFRVSELLSALEAMEEKCIKNVANSCSSWDLSSPTCSNGGRECNIQQRFGHDRQQSVRGESGLASHTTSQLLYADDEESSDESCCEERTAMIRPSVTKIPASVAKDQVYGRESAPRNPLETANKNVSSENVISVSLPSVNFPSDCLLSIRHITLCTPNEGHVLMRGFSLDVMRGENVLITGESGCGKTAIARLLTGLWTASKGEVITSLEIGPCGIFIIPQEPMFVPGSLTDQVCFPDSSDDPVSHSNQEKIRRLISRLNLTTLSNRLGLCEPHDLAVWYQSLSAGEAQRVCLARALYHSPPLAVLDESTCHVTESLQSAVYEVLAEQGVTVLTLGHRRSLHALHDKIIRLGD